VYGTWVPKDTTNLYNITYPEPKPEKAVLKLTLDVGEDHAKLLRHLDEKIRADNNFLPNKESTITFKYNNFVKDTSITMVSNIFKSITEWRLDHSNQTFQRSTQDMTQTGGSPVSQIIGYIVPTIFALSTR
jgi:hypothetical protein